jgi:hypothetical protein
MTLQPDCTPLYDPALFISACNRGHFVLFPWSERAPDGAVNDPPPSAAERSGVETGERCLLPRIRVRVPFLFPLWLLGV